MKLELNANFSQYAKLVAGFINTIIIGANGSYFIIILLSSFSWSPSYEPSGLQISILFPLLALFMFSWLIDWRVFKSCNTKPRISLYAFFIGGGLFLLVGLFLYLKTRNGGVLDFSTLFIAGGLFFSFIYYIVTALKQIFSLFKERKFSQLSWVDICLLVILCALFFSLIRICVLII